MAGTWKPMDSSAGLVGPFWNVRRFGPGQAEGVVLGGWAFNGSFGGSATNVTPVRALALSQDGAGLMHNNSTQLLGDPTTNGAGAVLVADFNGDGFDDLVLTAHNESPFIAKASVAWISTSSGTLVKQTLPDAVMNHDARVVTLGGAKKILARSFGGSGTGGNGPGFNVLYSWRGSGFDVLNIGDYGGMSVTAGGFGGDGSDWIAIGDTTYASGVPYSASNPMLNYVYKFTNNAVVAPALALPAPYFNGKAQYAGFSSFWDPYSKTHTSRLWTTDLNQDGLPDILGGQEIWAPGPGLQKAVFQLLINKGGAVFEDRTDALAPEFSQDANIDYSARFVALDASGIDTIFLSGTQLYNPLQDAAKQGQYIIVNDGTGRLYVAMHDEFKAMGPQVVSYLQSQLPSGQNANQGLTPVYYAYRTATGSINFVAMVSVYDPAANGQTFGLVNVPLGINLATDFRRNLTVATRNGSRNIRTFAGNDTIHRALSDPDCKIDGGNGVNTVVYPGPRANWVITRTGSQLTIRPTGGGGTDTLTRIQKAQFDDLVVDLSTI